MVQTVHKSIEIPQLQYCDEVIDVTVVSVVQVPREPRGSDVLVPQVQVVAETAEIPQLKVVEKIG